MSPRGLAIAKLIASGLGLLGSLVALAVSVFMLAVLSGNGSRHEANMAFAAVGLSSLASLGCFGATVWSIRGLARSRPG